MATTAAKRLVIVVGLVLAAAACGGGGGGGGSETETDASIEVSATTVSDWSSDARGDSDESSDGEGSDEPETLDDYLGTGYFSLDPDDSAANYARREQQVQELIAECMAREGFEFVPATRPVEDSVFGVTGDVEFAREYGFGISTLHGETTTFYEDDWDDPNQAIVASLSESERDAYYETLYGSSYSDGAFGSVGDSATSTFDGDESTEVEVEDPAFEGCNGQAYEEVYAYDELTEIFEQLDLESLFERVEADPRAAEINAEWSECMAERGYDYEDPNAMNETVYTDFYERYEAIVGPSGGFFDPFAGMSDEEIEELLSSLSPEELDDFFTQEEQTAPDVDQEALAALQGEERALAVANAECSEGLVEQYLELYREYEAAPVAENRALLEQFRESREG